MLVYVSRFPILLPLSLSFPFFRTYQLFPLPSRSYCLLSPTVVVSCSRQACLTTLPSCPPLLPLAGCACSCPTCSIVTTSCLSYVAIPPSTYKSAPPSHTSPPRRRRTHRIYLRIHRRSARRRMGSSRSTPAYAVACVVAPIAAPAYLVVYVVALCSPHLLEPFHPHV